MPLFLYDCLRAVRLQHLYARFNSLGICHAAHLPVLNREDYPLLGIHTMEDRTRFIQLVQLIKTLDADSSLGGCNEGGTVDCHNSYGTSHDEDSIGAAVSNPIASTSARPSHVCAQLGFSNETSHHRKRLSHPVVHINASHARYEELIQGKESATSVWHHFKPKSKRATVASRTLKHKPLQHNNRKGATKKKNLYTEMSTDGCMCKETPVYEAKRTAGYNYGLPLSTPPAQSKLQSKEKRIKVCVRKRPLTCAESKGEADVVTTPGEECVIVHEDKETVDLSQYILQHKFYFDQVFGEESCNEEVYQKTAYPLVQHMLKGGKVTCFAYGQTGAGKTHTMLGSPTRPGLYALAVQDIFAHLAATHSSQLVYVSFFEIYCGQLYDLLDHRKRLYAREDGRRMVHISGLREVRVDSVSLLLKVISQGTAERTQGMSGVNPLSSRSHALLHIQLRDPNQQKAGRMWFVDLAGSERASDSKEPDRQSRLEGAEINQSLLALKECIRSLDQEQSHTPFRQSKLTQVLKDSFVGDSMTCMIANISPGHTATEHTLNTLRYADRVKELRRQRGLRGRRRNSSKAATSPKQNLFSSSADHSVSTRGKGPPKKPKLTGQSEAFGPTSPTTRSLLGSAFLCSTPQISKCGEEANARSRGETGLEHVTPVRGWLRMGEKRHKTNGADELEGGRIGNDRYESAARQSVREQSPGGEEGEAHEADLSYTERKSEFCSREEENEQHILEGGIEKGKKSREANSKGERIQERELPNTNERDKEKERHLRWYHKQLQQFTPSSASSSIHLSSPSTDPSSSSSSSSYQGSVSHLSISSHMSHGLEQVLDGYTARSEGRVDGNRGRVLSPSGEIQLQTETSTVSNNINEEDAHGDSDGFWKNSRASLEGMEAGFGQERSKSEKRISLEASTEERQRRKHEHISTPLTLDMLSDVSFKSKHTRCIPDAVPPNGHREKEPWFDATVRKRPFLYAQSATLALTASITPPEPLNKLPENSAHTQGHNQSDVKMTALPHNETQADSFSSIMNAPSISQLHVDRQAATLSFLRGDDSNTKVSLLKNESGKDKKRDVVENEGLPLCFVELPQVKTLHSPISETMTATNHTLYPAILEGVLGSVQDQESSQKQTPPTLSNIPAASPLKNLQESSSNHQIRPTIHLFNLDNLDYAKWCIFKAHWEQLKEMEALYLKEGKLLCQLPDMAFEEYVHRLEEIMEKKALCVDRIRAQLQPHVKPIPSNHSEGADNHNSTS